MRLSEEYVQLFYKLFPALLLYVNSKENIIKDISTTDDLMTLPAEKRVQVRNHLYDNISIIDAFAKKNPSDFNPDEIEIVRSWKYFIRDRFLLFRHLKKHSVFLNTTNPPKAYGVVSISDELGEMFPSVPLFVETVLIPFKDKIIYDGYVGAFNIGFGGGARRAVKASYDSAKATYGIITSLPYKPKDVESSNENRLKEYLKNERSRQDYWHEIQELIYSDTKLMVLYHQQMGKVHARSYGRRLHEIGLSDSWFAILEGLIVASGKTKEELVRNLTPIVPPDKREFVFLYRLK